MKTYESEPPTLSTTGRGRLRAPEGGWATGAQVEVAKVVSRRLTGEDVGREMGGEWETTLSKLDQDSNPNLSSAGQSNTLVTPQSIRTLKWTIPQPESSMHLPGVGFSRSSVRLLVLTSFYLLFLVLGASIFSAIEGPEEVQLIRQLRHMRLQFLKHHQCVPGYLPRPSNYYPNESMLVRLHLRRVDELYSLPFNFTCPLRGPCWDKTGDVLISTLPRSRFGG
ncbi:unnamed protein product, partial [Timema podura]|nr:unnamed protein product [Timema podura]